MNKCTFKVALRPHKLDFIFLFAKYGLNFIEQAVLSIFRTMYRSGSILSIIVLSISLFDCMMNVFDSKRGKVP